MIDEERYRAWRDEIFGTDYLIWHDGLDTSQVQRLSGKARQAALEMLRYGLETGDWVAAQALAAMDEKGSAEAMRDQLPHLEGKPRVQMALAIRRLTGANDVVDAVIDVLDHPSWGERFEAAIALREFDGPEVTRALLDAVRTDPDYLVRYHAVESLFHLHGIDPPKADAHGELFDDIVEVEGEDPARLSERQQRAAAWLEQRIGASAQEQSNRSDPREDG